MAENLIKLNKPELKGDFMNACQTRKSCREYDPNKELSLQQLSNFFGALMEIIVKIKWDKNIIF